MLSFRTVFPPSFRLLFLQVITSCEKETTQSLSSWPRITAAMWEMLPLQDMWGTETGLEWGPSSPTVQAPGHSSLNGEAICLL